MVKILYHNINDIFTIHNIYCNVQTLRFLKLVFKYALMHSAVIFIQISLHIIQLNSNFTLFVMKYTDIQISVV